MVDSIFERPLESYDFVALAKILEHGFLKDLMRNIVPSLKDETSDDNKCFVSWICMDLNLLRIGGFAYVVCFLQWWLVCKLKRFWRFGVWSCFSMHRCFVLWFGFLRKFSFLEKRSSGAQGGSNRAGKEIIHSRVIQFKFSRSKTERVGKSSFFVPWIFSFNLQKISN